MARILADELECCRTLNACYDCHCFSEDEPKAAVEFQTRGALKVPCCRKHFNAYKSKTSQANAKKYARRSAASRKAGLCVFPGCHHKLIPQELLPQWWKRERTCGMHVPFKAFRVNHAAIVKFIVEHCLSPGLGEGMVAQSIIYQPKEGYIFFGLSKPGLYLTRGFWATDLRKRYEDFHKRNPGSFAAKFPTLQTLER